MDGEWKLLGYDTFAEEYYTIGSTYNTEEQAKAAAKKKLAELEREQPSSSSGGQAEAGIQDRVYIVRPDGSRYRFVL